MALGQTNVQQPRYEDFEPFFDWLQDSESHTLCSMLPGFKKEQLKVQITSTRILKVSGEKKTSENKLLKFHKELPIPNDADINGIRAKFESGVLYIRLPKTNTTTTPLQESQKKPQQEGQEEQKKYYDENKKDKGKIDEEKEDVKKDNFAKDNESGEGTSSKGELSNDNNKGIMEKRTPTLEFVSGQTEEYKSAVYGLVGQVKKQRKLVNLVVVVLIVLVFVIYVNNAIESYFGGSKSQEL